MPTFENQKA